jgi:polyhydroxybutyrate depolymerase
MKSHLMMFCCGRARGCALLFWAALVASCSSDATNGDEEARQPDTRQGNNSPQLPTGMTPPAAAATPNQPSPSSPAAETPARSEGNMPNVDPSNLNEPPAAGSAPGGAASSPMAMGSGGSAGQMGSAGSGGAAGSAQGAAGSAAQPVSDCPAQVLAAGNTTRTLQVGNAMRSYVLHVPSTYTGNQRVPLLFDFHGLGGSGQGEANSSSYVAATQSEGVILAFPTGTSDGIGQGWNVGTCCAGGDDVAFTRAMVTQIQSLACIDNKRIYVSGFSNGGGMSHKLACEAADIIAAVAPASFDFGEDNVDDCNPSRPISVVMQRGTNDFAVPFEGGATPVTNRIVFLGAQATFDKWSELDGCTGPEQDIGNNCRQRSQCNAGVETSLCVIQGGGHQPPNANLLWPILREYSLP